MFKINVLNSLNLSIIKLSLQESRYGIQLEVTRTPVNEISPEKHKYKIYLQIVALTLIFVC